MKLLACLTLALALPAVSWAQSSRPPDSANYGEPIAGQLIRQISLPAVAKSTAKTSARPFELEASGLMQSYQLLLLDIADIQLYDSIEFTWQPAVVGQADQKDQADQADNGRPRPTEPVSLVVYAGVSRRPEPTSDRIPQLFQGQRLLTKGMGGQSKLQFRLPLRLPQQLATANAHNALPASHTVSSQIQADIAVGREQFPLYIALYPFTSARLADSLNPSYRYHIRLIEKDYGFVRFHLLPPPADPNTSKPSTNHSNEAVWGPFTLQIDQQNYPYNPPDDWQAEAARYVQDSQASQAPQPLGSGWQSAVDGVNPAGANQLSAIYRLATGRHSVQISNQKYYGRNQFQLGAGALLTVSLQLQERLAQVAILVPRGAIVLLDGIPLQQKQGQTPVWQGLEVQQQEGFYHDVPRLQYSLRVPAGKHHLLLQYEGRTWQQEVYAAEGTEQVFQLNWELSYRANKGEIK